MRVVKMEHCQGCE